MGLSHEPWLVALSLLVAFQGSYIGLHLARQVAGAAGGRRRALIAASAFSLALGIWTMHFVGMLAARLPVAVDFLVLPTLLSFLVCVLVVGLAVFEVGTGAPSRLRIGLAALAMGGGIVTMHYLGMYALHASLHMTHDPLLVAASVAIGIAASAASLWFGFGPGAKRSLLAAAGIMALAISAMHYTAMAGTRLMLHDQGLPPEMPALSPSLLAIVVSIVAFVVSGLFLLTLVPGGDRAGAVREAIPTVAPAEETQPAAVPEQPAPQEEPPLPAAAQAQTLPVEKDRLRLQLEVSRLVAVQAQAHYTQLFDGEATWFCPLPISEVEALLDPAIFARVHRSHIVNLDRVAGLRRTADSETVAMLARTPYQAPVSRAKRGWLKQRLQERLQERTRLAS